VSEINHKLVSVHNQKAFCLKEGTVWCNKFKDVRTALNDDPEKNRGKTKAWHNDGHWVITKDLMREDRRVKVREIALQKEFSKPPHLLEKKTTVKDCLAL
jgi:hypothetical protein